MPGRLDQKAAIVTGGATGIGEAIARKFAREGARVVVSGLPTDPVEDVVNAVLREKGSAVGYVGDVSIEPNAEACVRKAVEAYGRLDILINNAGVFLVTAETQNYPTDEFDATVRSNIRSCFMMTKWALPQLQMTRGCIVSAGSESGMLGLAYNTPYGGTKAWIHAFMRGVAVEQAKYGVRANSVAPGAIDTAWTHADLGPMTRKMEKSVVTAAPMGRRGTVEEVANVYAFLASDEASYVTGAVWAVDGGVTVGKGPIGDEVPSKLAKEPTPTISDLQHTHDGLKGKRTHTTLG